jgi:hypothetical protein
MSGKRGKTKGFSIFRSASEEAEIKEGRRPVPEEGGHSGSRSGRIVSRPGAEMPFTAVMTREDGRTSEASFATMGEAEAFVRRNTPRPETRSTTYDHDAG